MVAHTLSFIILVFGTQAGLEAISVYIAYWTAFLAGAASARPDGYGRAAGRIDWLTSLKGVIATHRRHWKA